MEANLPKVRKMLGRRIRALRISRGMTQEQLGEKADTNYKYLGSVERGERNPSLDNLVRIAEGLGIPLADLLTFEHETPDVADLKNQVIALLNSADASGVRQAYRLLRIMFE